MRPAQDLASRADQFLCRTSSPHAKQSCAQARLQIPKAHPLREGPGPARPHKKSARHQLHAAEAELPDAPAAIQSPAPISDCEMKVDCSAAGSVRPLWAKPAPECTDIAQYGQCSECAQRPPP